MLMKKLFVFLALIFSIFGANAATVTFLSSCNKTATTLPPSAFKSEAEAYEYYMELNRILCNETSEDWIVFTETIAVVG